jgi:hypothetical protein
VQLFDNLAHEVIDYALEPLQPPIDRLLDGTRLWFDAFPALAMLTIPIQSIAVLDISRCSYRLLTSSPVGFC